MKLFIFAALFIIFSFAASYTIGLFEIPDAYFYFVLGKHLLTGQLLPVAPLNAEIPQTLFGPVYAMLSYLAITLFPGPQVLLPLIQLMMVLVSSIFVYSSAQKLLPKAYAAPAVMLFLLLPFVVLYAFVFMSEITAMFLVSLCLVIYTRCSNKLLKFSLLAGITSLLALTRFAFIPWVFFSLLGLLIALIRSIHKKNLRIQHMLIFIPAVFGGISLLLWIGYNMHWYNKPMLSSFTGRHAYNNVITAGKFIPKHTDNPAVKTFLSYIPPGADLARPWWDILPYFSGAFYEKKLTEVEIDQLFLQMSIQGIKEHIVPYVFHIIRLAIITPNTPPYFDNVLTQIGIQEPNCPICSVKVCRFVWMPEYCKPVAQQPVVLALFAKAILFTRSLYPFVTTILMITAFIGTLFILYKRKKTLIMLTGILYFQHFFQSASEWVEGRFLLPLYPLYTIIIIYGWIFLVYRTKKALQYIMKQTT